MTLTQSLIKLNKINEELENIDTIAEKKAAEIFTDEFKKQLENNLHNALKNIK